jgi:Icc-related predicted phosphoesterase
VRPSIHAFGHIHESFGFEIMEWDSGEKTLAINASICDLKHQAINPAIVVDIERSRDGPRPHATVVTAD